MKVHAPCESPFRGTGPIKSRQRTHELRSSAKEGGRGKTQIDAKPSREVAIVCKSSITPRISPCSGNCLICRRNLTGFLAATGSALMMASVAGSKNDWTSQRFQNGVQVAGAVQQRHARLCRVSCLAAFPLSGLARAELIVAVVLSVVRGSTATATADRSTGGRPHASSRSSRFCFCDAWGDINLAPFVPKNASGSVLANPQAASSWAGPPS